jgi:hypothetical protein
VERLPAVLIVIGFPVVVTLLVYAYRYLYRAYRYRKFGPIVRQQDTYFSSSASPRQNVSRRRYLMQIIFPTSAFAFMVLLYVFEVRAEIFVIVLAISLVVNLFLFRSTE